MRVVATTGLLQLLAAGESVLEIPLTTGGGGAAAVGGTASQPRSLGSGSDSGMAAFVMLRKSLLEPGWNQNAKVGGSRVQCAMQYWPVDVFVLVRLLDIARAYLSSLPLRLSCCVLQVSMVDFASELFGLSTLWLPGGSDFYTKYSAFSS
jgi:hypothetical protein